MPTTAPVALIGLCNPKSPGNVGAVRRAASCYGAKAIRYTGVRFARATKFHTDTHKGKAPIPLSHVSSFTEDLPEHIKVVCVELVEGATPLPEFTHPNTALYIFGPEDGSIPEDIVAVADSVVYIPTIGCMNLAATVNVVLYDRLAKSDAVIDHDERVKSSRDGNNRLIVNK